MAGTYWVLAPVKVQSKDESPALIVPEAETLQRAIAGCKFTTADDAMTWLELIGYPEDECSFEDIEGK